MENMTETLGLRLIWFFTKVPYIGDAMAAVLALGLIITAIMIGTYYYFKYHRPLINAVNKRVTSLSKIIGDSNLDVNKAREGFAKQFNDVHSAMMQGKHREITPLKRTWEEYRETIIDESAEVLQNTARPEYFFLPLADKHKGLNWFSNIFIALGLLITFLGIIAALSTLDFSGGVEQMQARLNELMKVAGAKFWASVGGIVASILLRALDYRFSKHTEDAVSMLCDKLEHGMVYLPPQRIANEQLHHLKEQTPALKVFSEQIATAIGDTMEKQMTPMISHLGQIQDGINKISGGGGEAIQQAISDNAGAEMTNLAEAIGSMTNSMAMMAEKMEKQSGEADRQIEEAVRRFGQASEEMRTVFGELNQNFSAVADRLREDSEEASQQTRERLATLLDTFGQSLDGMKAGIEKSTKEMGKASALVAQDAARVGQDALKESFASFANQFNQAGKPLVESMEKAQGAISRSADGLNSSQMAIGDHARSIEGIAKKSDDLVMTFGAVANDFQRAAAPVHQSAEAIEKSVQSLEKTIESEAKLAGSARGEIQEMAVSLKDTAVAAEQAWSDYRTRFTEVDKSLGEALNLLTDASSSHAQNLNDRVGQIDAALGDGVAQLAGAFEPLTTLRDTVEELAGSLNSKPLSSVK